jgi:hypothetical protein
VHGFALLARYNTDGSLDTTFATDGYQTPEFRIAGIAIQSDGKTVVAGDFGGLDSIVLARYNIDGTPILLFPKMGSKQLPRNTKGSTRPVH